jgi:hypothetical protein
MGAVYTAEEIGRRRNMEEGKGKMAEQGEVWGEKRKLKTAERWERNERKGEEYRRRWRRRRERGRK